MASKRIGPAPLHPLHGLTVESDGWIATPSTPAEWREWINSRRLEMQRQRRKKKTRIDYYPSDAALAEIKGRTSGQVDGDYSSVINALVLAGAEQPQKS